VGDPETIPEPALWEVWSALGRKTLGIVSYDDEAGAYHRRAYNDGRYLETELKLADNGKGIT
jgi:hypothetical protein